MCEQGVYDKLNLRKTVEGMLYRMRVGCPWREIFLKNLVGGIQCFKNLINGHQKVS